MMQRNANTIHNSSWIKAFDELLELGIKMNTEQMVVVSGILKQIFMDGKIEGLKDAVKIQTRLNDKNY